MFSIDYDRQDRLLRISRLGFWTTEEVRQYECSVRDALQTVRGADDFDIIIHSWDADTLPSEAADTLRTVRDAITASALTRRIRLCRGREQATGEAYSCRRCAIRVFP
jgi:hypothetical protein